MKTEYKKVKIEFVDKMGTTHKVGDEVLVLPEASNEKQYCIGIDVGISDYIDKIYLDYVDEEYLKNRQTKKREKTIYDSYYYDSYYYDDNDFEIDELINLLVTNKEELNKKGITDNIRVSVDFDSDYETYQINVSYYEYETEEEYHKRMLSNEMLKQRQISQMQSLINGNFEEAVKYINSLKEKQKTL